MCDLFRGKENRQRHVDHARVGRGAIRHDPRRGVVHEGGQHPGPLRLEPACESERLRFHLVESPSMRTVVECDRCRVQVLAHWPAFEASALRASRRSA